MITFMLFEKQLIDAVEENKDIEAMFFLRKGANVNAKNRFGVTPLHLAIKTGYKKLAKLLIDAGADVNATDQSGWAPLYLAARYRRVEITKLLLSKDAKVKESQYISLYTSFCRDIYASTKTFFLFKLFGARLSNDDQKDIDNNIVYQNSLTEFDKIASMPNLGKLIEANIKRDRKESAKAIAEYINDKAKEQELIKEFQAITKRYSSDEQLFFIPEYLLNHIQHLCQQYLQMHKNNTFRTGALAEFLRLVLQDKGNFDLNKKMEIQDYGFIESSNDALNLSVVCKSINAEARQHANINSEECKRKTTTLLTQLKRIEPLEKDQHMEIQYK